MKLPGDFEHCVAMAVVLLLLLLPLVSPLNHEGLNQGFVAGKALMSIKESFSNVVNVLHDWDDANNEDFCSWRGVFCDNDSFSVVSLNLSSLNLGGEISPAIGDLRNLQSIDFQGNMLTGQIPEEIGNCASLYHLDLSDNLLYGDIPYSLSKLKQLDTLNLKNNQLAGPIPSTVTQIPNLKILDLAKNQLTGEIPRLIYWNEVLQYLGLRGNLLSGTLSEDICQLTCLCDVRDNNLTGTIPSSIGNCTSFEILDISYNQFTGEIPYNIGFLQVATLSLQGNNLTGRIPEVIGLMQALAVLDLSDNELVGPIPAILGNLSYTGKLYLHGNKLTGPIPPELGNMSKLSYLQLNDNQLVGSIPPELGKLEQLFELNLANNHLEGPIPQNISVCRALNQLNVHGNHLSGIIPSGFKDLGSLTYLNLSSNDFKGRVPVELGRIINLDTLDLSSNNFSGAIPASIGDLEHLLTLNLSRNHLHGRLPAEFGNLRSIQIIDLSFNNVTSSIPVELGQLQNIVSLILNNNDLQGEIPELTNCFSLVNSNFSYNNLSGIVPLVRNLTRYPPDSFIGNPLLCGNRLGSICGPFVPKSKVIFSRAAAVCPPKLVVLHMDMAIHTFDDIMRNTENLSEKYIIGYGASSTVYKCVLKNSRPLAIKRVYNQTPNLHEFETELETTGSIRHRNIVSLHGYALSPHGNLLFYDYMKNGSLWDLLHATKTHASTFVMGTIGYIDPEYARTSQLTEKSDVYSFGVVLLELLTGKKAVDNESNLQQLILSRADDNTVMEAVDPEVSVTCMDLTHVKKSFQLALLCTKHHPSERPTMQDVSRVLLSLIPSPTKASLLPKPIDYAKFVIDKGQQQPHLLQENSSSDATLVHEVQSCIKEHSLSS
ncbi:hypothetical protein DKX38_023138 [Salix brachista]|uniref:non-specific serine/threonine protein kinase n=1 Tax=Salix brachista TaxID=2182728 RepID=A0A5N5K1C2_9ROSI|nr:hypothetical protein DKX38_023138 [Salix brachista]